MTTTTRPMTAEELLLLPDDGYRYELVRGELEADVARRELPWKTGIQCPCSARQLCSRPMTWDRLTLPIPAT